jgi:hypothetical protein
MLRTSRLGGLFGLCAALSLPGVAAAQTGDLESIIRDRLENDVLPVLRDVDIILLEGVEYFAARLPAMQAGGEPLAQMDLYAAGDFSVGVGLMSGVYVGFRDVGDDFETIPNQIPEPTPVPAIMVMGRYAAHPDLELGARYGFFPSFDIEQDDFRIRGGTSLYGARARYRAVRGHGVKPTITVQGAGSYFTGFLDIGQDFSFVVGQIEDPQLNAAINQAIGRPVVGPGTPLDGGVTFTGAPIIGWDIWQASFESRAIWDADFWHPFVGGGVDLAFGSVDSGTKLAMEGGFVGPADFVDEFTSAVGARPTFILLEPSDITVYTREPRLFGGRALGGMEFDLGSVMRLGFEAQVDVGTLSYVGGFSVRYAHSEGP